MIVAEGCSGQDQIIAAATAAEKGGRGRIPDGNGLWSGR